MFEDIDSLSEALYSNIGQADIRYLDDNYLMATMMDLNLNRFGFNKSLAKVVDLNKALQEAKGWSDFKTKAKSILGNYDMHHRLTEYNLAVATAQNGARWNEQKAERDTFPYLEYQTAGDERVRESHKALDGKLFLINDTSWRGLYPPNGYGCRCEMVQVDQFEADERHQDIITGEDAAGLMGEDFDRIEKAGFNANRGEVGEIFDLNRTYAKQLESIAGDIITKLSYKNIGLPGMAELTSNVKFTAQSTTPNQVLESFGEDPYQTYIDYLGRIIGLKKQTVKAHSTDRYVDPPEVRFKTFNAINEVLESPDEVWMTEFSKDKYQYNYIKFYDEFQLVVSVNIDDMEGFEIQTWYKLTEKQESSNRKGVLIKKAY